MDSKAEFEALASPHLDALYRTALRMTGEAASAEDLVQEAALRGFRAFGRFERGTNFKAWIFTILTNLYINEYRRKERGPALVDFSESEPAGVEEPAHLTSEDVERLAEHLGDEARKALGKVPPEFRIVFLLSTFEEMSYKEISAVVGIPIGTVMSRLFRARRILREELGAFARQAGFREEGSA
jgi:RNA polymerase sigma-70 factor (ECF subfamily)